MMHRYGLDRFKKAQTADPFSVNNSSIHQSTAAAASTQSRSPYFSSYTDTKLASVQARPPPSLNFNEQVRAQPSSYSSKAAAAEPTPQTSSVGGGQSTWQPPDWAVEPRPGVFWLDVLKDGEVVDKISLEKKRNIFGRQAIMCDFVLDHPSVSRQHAVVVQHKNGSIYVIDLGSVHGTFVANERLTKDSPVELEVGQSLRFAASTRSYVLRKGVVQAPQSTRVPPNFVMPPPPDPSDEDAVVAYNTLLNKMGLSNPNNKVSSKSKPTERPSKKPKKSRVTFRDQYNGLLIEVVGISDGADVSNEPGPLGVKEGSLVGKFDNLVEVTLIPKEKGSNARTVPSSGSSKGVTEKLQQFLEKVKSPGKGGLYDDSLAAPLGASWAKSETSSKATDDTVGSRAVESHTENKSSSFDDDLDDLFGDVGT